MSLKPSLSKPFARFIVGRRNKKDTNPGLSQRSELQHLVKKAAGTAFGTDHDFEGIKNHGDFAKRVPVRTYEELKPYIERAVAGETSVLWPGKPLYFCKTSGTTAGAKYIPLTKDSLPNHIGTARNALLSYVAETGNADFVDGKMIFLQGSPVMEKLDSGIPFGRLSGIVANHVPAYLLKNRMPSYETNCIDDWETKVDAIVGETVKENMTLISGIPSWVQMYFERLIEKTGKASVSEVFPKFSLFVYGGVNFEPYRNSFRQLIGKDIPSIELYPASEGFIAYQDSQEAEGMRLVLNSGLFYEFIPMSEYHSDNPPRLTVDQVELDVNYALVLSNNAGLWGYSIGDTVKFVSLDPPRLKVTGRIKHFISAFGEHVISEEVEKAMKKASDELDFAVSEFHVAPQVNPELGLPYHEWFIETEHQEVDRQHLSEILDKMMIAQNPYYDDLISGNILRPAVVSIVPPGSFRDYMRSIGKLGGQNKVPRLSNDRKVADALAKMVVQ